MCRKPFSVNVPTVGACIWRANFICLYSVAKRTGENQESIDLTIDARRRNQIQMVEQLAAAPQKDFRALKNYGDHIRYGNPNKPLWQTSRIFL